MGLFKLKSDYQPAGDQPAAIAALVKGLREKRQAQTLLGVTGSGKTFTLANVIAAMDRPVLVMSHNKTLAAQLYSEFKAFFPENAVEYFVSYYDYYLPESYIPQTDTYIAKDASINENIERLRLSSTAALIERRDVIVVASVSSIYNLGSPEDFEHMCVPLRVGGKIERNDLLRDLVAIQYERNDVSPEQGEFRVRGDSVDVFEPQRQDFIRINFWGSDIEGLSRHDIVTGKQIAPLNRVILFPCRHFVMPPDRVEGAIEKIKKEMKERVTWFEENGRLVEAQRLYQRVNYDIEMIREIGYCSGIENYSMYFAERQLGSLPHSLFGFFPKDMLTVIDESHVTIPQIGAMYKADRSRKETLVEHGFRLPSALENRPLKFDEFEKIHGDTIYVSATPAAYELEKSDGEVVEQIIRPTGLLDPEVEVRPLEGQVDDVMAEIRLAAERDERVLVTTLSKKSAERLADYLNEMGLRANYLHSELDALERVRVLNKLRAGNFDCLIGINLLREGIDMPEVALVAILDADKQGFLRSERSLIQVAGRAARNVNGRVILYGEKITDAMQKLIQITNSRRKKQLAYNKKYNITPTTIAKSERQSIADVIAPEKKKIEYSYDEKNHQIYSLAESPTKFDPEHVVISEEEMELLVLELEKEMLSAADALEFERAADIRDRLKELTPKK